MATLDIDAAKEVQTKSVTESLGGRKGGGRKGGREKGGGGEGENGTLVKGCLFISCFSVQELFLDAVLILEIMTLH